MENVLMDLEHYKLSLADTPRMTDSGIAMHYVIHNKYTGVDEGYVQMYPQAVDITNSLNDAMKEIVKSTSNIVTLVH